MPDSKPYDLNLWNLAVIMWTEAYNHILSFQLLVNYELNQFLKGDKKKLNITRKKNGGRTKNNAR